ncbi:hypothetical protein BJV85_002824 [Clostridium acetobutylicum]|uniref:Uncharacterized protein n=1 Tax=Clostridium acetobutylicum (strain ATCC 824 / DSM 792 / JCM 1419 / IAM 19013 / LMG 5710 / NBRC 13948 / NRRL B-527 / VKM B-1787 / 2291 / W) TaxID=272562 RepID=Q97JV0_CLOAB|nr:MULTISPECIES: hypothetical protein [Clostridium]AAK79145.1 Hypothetical protein CA_C1173 [Clostridium acetobutylicum ATCC 824]AEI31680.1 hypothetical protein SMB_G1193 [Clostridium acetobutylicum DSM 1731]AWV82256.1 hypothetical protein DK921_16190 [Clostridium acetobutylicum]MBC2393244.1 hypothetical protein [Clostridium acetobutylicum]MBC2585790.1 hypothetical protein [Clostridium acetobutylicum]
MKNETKAKAKLDLFKKVKEYILSKGENIDGDRFYMIPISYGYVVLYINEWDWQVGIYQYGEKQNEKISNPINVNLQDSKDIEFCKSAIEEILELAKMAVFTEDEKKRYDYYERKIEMGIIPNKEIINKCYLYTFTTNREVSALF